MLKESESEPLWLTRDYNAACDPVWKVDKIIPAIKAKLVIQNFDTNFASWDQWHDFVGWRLFYL